MSQKARNHVSENFKYLGEHAIQTSSKVCVALQRAMLGMQDLDLSEYELLTRKFLRDDWQWRLPVICVMCTALYFVV